MSNPITGMMNFFYQNSLITEANTLTASSGAAIANVIDFDRSTKWQSSGSNDLTTETLLATFTAAQSINSILLIGINWKEFTIQYESSPGIYSNLSNVWSLSSETSAAASINPTTNTLYARMFLFDSVSTTGIRIRPLKTIVSDQEKYLFELYIGYRIGTMSNDLACVPNSFKAIARNTNSAYIKKSNGGITKYEFSDKYSVKVNIKNMWESADIAIIDELFNVGEFAVYPCGGKNDYTVQKGWRIQDFYNVVLKSDQNSEFSIGRDPTLGMNYDFELLEQ